MCTPAPTIEREKMRSKKQIRIEQEVDRNEWRDFAWIFCAANHVRSDVQASLGQSLHDGTMRRVNDGRAHCRAVLSCYTAAEQLSLHREAIKEWRRQIRSRLYRTCVASKPLRLRLHSGASARRSSTQRWDSAAPRLEGPRPQRRTPTSFDATSAHLRAFAFGMDELTEQEKAQEPAYVFWSSGQRQGR